MDAFVVRTLAKSFLQCVVGQEPSGELIAVFTSVAKRVSYEHVSEGDVIVPLRSVALREATPPDTPLAHLLHQPSQHTLQMIRELVSACEVPIARLELSGGGEEQEDYQNSGNQKDNSRAKETDKSQKMDKPKAKESDKGGKDRNKKILHIYLAQAQMMQRFSRLAQVGLAYGATDILDQMNVSISWYGLGREVNSDTPKTNYLRAEKANTGEEEEGTKLEVQHQNKCEDNCKLETQKKNALECNLDTMQLRRDDRNSQNNMDSSASCRKNQVFSEDRNLQTNVDSNIFRHRASLPVQDNQLNDGRMVSGGTSYCHGVIGWNVSDGKTRNPRNVDSTGTSIQPTASGLFEAEAEWVTVASSYSIGDNCDRPIGFENFEHWEIGTGSEKSSGGSSWTKKMAIRREGQEENKGTEVEFLDENASPTEDIKKDEQFVFLTVFPERGTKREKRLNNKEGSMTIKGLRIEEEGKSGKVLKTAIDCKKEELTIANRNKEIEDKNEEELQVEDTNEKELEAESGIRKGSKIVDEIKEGLNVEDRNAKELRNNTNIASKMAQDSDGIRGGEKRCMKQCFFSYKVGYTSEKNFEYFNVHYVDFTNDPTDVIWLVVLQNNVRDFTNHWKVKDVDPVNIENHYEKTQIKKKRLGVRKGGHYYYVGIKWTYPELMAPMYYEYKDRKHMVLREPWRNDGSLPGPLAWDGHLDFLKHEGEGDLFKRPISP